MTKRALIIISALILLPLILTGVAWSRARQQNPVVAKWADDRVGIIYLDEEYKPIGEVGDYSFTEGRYLGRIGDSLFGAPLYTVSGDKAGYLCYALDDSSMVLLSVTGELLDAVSSDGPDEIRLGATRTSNADDISMLYSLDALTDPAQFTDEDDLPISFSTKKYRGKYFVYKIWEYYGSSAIGIDSGARIFHMEESGNWYYVSAEDAASAEADGETYRTYNARPLKDKDALEVVERLIGGANAADTDEADTQ